ncbi:Re/Si-specific NAD(P)(+) transhydrogenase subunit alpha [Leptonema illini]|uniref:NAD(P) transhydrogenase subunit alpha part 1 n=1 Tax=Leptonema illini DSM 21528 TaxID=929563 RepID=H2CI56_9LEPT|nr:Re/Si-specific NAD(P)(+) transhydrogenase subunit alpha [Leptonema illini]EHQ08079.1 alanine dehydrogenase/PNT domain protein [Leptonema illini DSM 21528]
MILAIPKETTEGEKRVAIVPETVSKLRKIGHTVRIQKGAGEASGFPDHLYEKEGAVLVDDVNDLYGTADVLLKVDRPVVHPSSGKSELEMMKKGAIFVGFFYSMSNVDLAKKAASTGVQVLSMDAVPRITKAQRMDALSSQTNLAGYKAVLLAADHLHKIFPLLMTAAGTISPAKVVILGAGVAGLQAIATAKRLGAVVEVSDVRPETKEQVQSLGGKFIEPPQDESLVGEGGYAKEASAEYLAKQQEILRKHICEADAVITTAQVPGRKAPVLIKADVVKDMQPGAVIVDMAAGTGGNCELTEPGQVVKKHGVTIVGHTNLPAELAYHASQLYSRNLQALIEYLTKEGNLNLDANDEIVKGALITRDGQIVHEKTRELAG